MNRFKQLRKEAGLTQVSLQIKTGIDQTVLSKFELGQRLPTADNLMLLADFYNTSTDYLLGRTDRREPYPPAEEPAEQQEQGR